MCEYLVTPRSSLLSYTRTYNHKAPRVLSQGPERNPHLGRPALFTSRHCSLTTLCSGGYGAGSPDWPWVPRSNEPDDLNGAGSPG